MKKLRILLLAVIFVAGCIGTGFTAPIRFEEAYKSENIKLEVDMGNVIFHKLDDNIAIEFASRATNIKENKMIISKIYAIPVLSKFRMLEFVKIDLSKKMITDKTTEPSDWSFYKNNSPTNTCINYIINNYEKKE